MDLIFGNFCYYRKCFIDTKRYCKIKSMGMFYNPLCVHLKKLATKMKKNAVGILLLLLMIYVTACRKDKSLTADKLLYNEINESGYTYYQNGNLLNGVSPSPHGAFKLRFNAIALAALDSLRELPKGSTFPEGAVLVKEVYENGSLSLYVVMKKEPSNQNEGSGWLWAEYNPDGSVDYPVNKKGQDCIGCHNGGLTRDLTRTFDLH